MISENEFSQITDDLSRFGSKGHELLVVRDGVLRTKSHGNWLHRFIQLFYKPKDERLRTIAKFALHFFQEHLDYTKDPAILHQLSHTLHKANYELKLNRLILQIQENNRENEISENQHNPLSHYLLEEALQAARDIEDEHIRAITLLKIATHQAKINREDAILTIQLSKNAARNINPIYIFIPDITLSLIAKTQASFDLEGAFETAEEITHESVRAKALSRISIVQTKTNLEDAIKTANSIRAAEIQAKALAKIAAIQTIESPENVPEAFQAAFITARDINAVYERSKAFCGITGELAKVDIEGALHATLEIQDFTYREKALTKIAIQQANSDIEKAIQITRLIHNFWYRETALVKIASVQAKTDPDKALEIARSIKNNVKQEQILSAVTVERAKIDPEHALESARQIKTTEFREFSKAKIAGIQAKNDLDTALDTANEIDYQFFHAKALAKIAKNLTEQDPERAIELIREITDKGCRAQALAKVATQTNGLIA